MANNKPTIDEFIAPELVSVHVMFVPGDNAEIFYERTYNIDEVHTMSMEDYLRGLKKRDES